MLTQVETLRPRYPAKKILHLTMRDGDPLKIISISIIYYLRS
jgi:hypothetical protein